MPLPERHVHEWIHGTELHRDVTVPVHVERCACGAWRTGYVGVPSRSSARLALEKDYPRNAKGVR